MNENTVPFTEKIVIGLKNAIAYLKATPLVTSLIAFCLVVLALILVAALALKEYVVSVCVLVVLEVLMSVLLHKAELWKHGILVAAQIVAGVVLKRIPLVAVCVAVYVAAMVTLHFMFIGKKDKGPKA